MSKPLILIVDDEPHMLNVMSRALELILFNTQTARNAETALELVRAAPPDAIMIDLKMPFINGLGFLHRLRETHPDLPAAIVTGTPELDDATLTEIRSLGADLRFKPITIAEIQALARHLVARRRELQ